MFQPTIFGGSSGVSYEDLQRKRAMAQALAQGSGGNISTVGEGINSAAGSIASALLGRQASKMEEQGRQEATDAYESALSGYGFGGPGPSAASAVLGGGGGGDVDWETAMDAIGFTESSNNYDALGPVLDSGSYAGDRAYGRYQVMGNNVGPWTEEVLGYRMTPQEFLASQEAQDAVFKGKFALDQGFNDAASIWHSGVPLAQAQSRNDGYIGTPDYVEKAAGRFGGGGVQTASNAPMGLDPGLVELVSNPFLSPEQRRVAETLLSQQLSSMQPASPRDQLELELLQAQIEKTRNAGGSAPTYGLTPQYLTDSEGNLKMMVLGNDGTSKMVDIPEGMAISKGMEKVDEGTHWQWYNKMTGEAVGAPISKNITEKVTEEKLAEAQGETQAEAIVNLPQSLSKGNRALDLIDQISYDPALASITGAVQGRLPPVGQGGVDLNAKIENLKGKVFLSAFESLKGGGTITEREGEAATNAIARLQRAQSVGAYQEALAELRSIMAGSIEKAQRAAAGNFLPTDVPPRPDGWGVDDWEYAWENVFTPENKDHYWKKALGQ